MPVHWQACSSGAACLAHPHACTCCVCWTSNVMAKCLLWGRTSNDKNNCHSPPACYVTIQHLLQPQYRLATVTAMVIPHAQQAKLQQQQEGQRLEGRNMSVKGKLTRGSLECEMEEHDSSDNSYDCDNGHQQSIYPDPLSFPLVLVGLPCPGSQPVLRNHKHSLAQHEAC